MATGIPYVCCRSYIYCEFSPIRVIVVLFIIMNPLVLYIQLYRLSRVDVHTVVLKPVHVKVTRHYSRYCAFAFCYVQACELSYMCPGSGVTLHPHPSEIISNTVCGMRLVLAKALT